MDNLNKLKYETSPYLLQHAENPINWHAWNDEAIERAKIENKLIFLSIGYSSCHWCHVMEKESFKDLKIAEILNQNFISIKVDREERPDIDKIYMDALMAMRGSGGWPMSIFLTPDLKPFWGGTYLPKEAFMDILENIKRLWLSSPNEILSSSSYLSHLLNTSTSLSKANFEISKRVINKAHEDISQSFDKIYGGFTPEPKFPSPQILQLLMRIYHRTKDEKTLNMVNTTLENIARGGIYDHLGGGFHRYSTDKKWEVPHFEKMLYDNATLAYTYLEAYQLTKNIDYKKIAQEILDYILWDMTSSKGAFYSSEDADSEGSEGIFYTWTTSQLKEILNEEAFEEFSKIYNIKEEGNFESRSNILYLHKDIPLNLKDTSYIKNIKSRLFMERRKRIHPFKDKKIICSWNALMIASLAKAYQIINHKQYIIAAENAASFIEQNLFKNKKLYRTYYDGILKQEAFLEDYVYMIYALLNLYEASFDSKWIYWAEDLQKIIDNNFYDTTKDAYSFTKKGARNLFKTSITFYDDVVPNPNALAILNLLKLNSLTQNQDYRVRAINLLLANTKALNEMPSIFPQTLIALEYYLSNTNELAIIGRKEDKNTIEYLSWLRGKFLPNTIIAQTDTKNKEPLPLLDKKFPLSGKTTIYICKNGSCSVPITEISEAKTLL